MDPESKIMKTSNKGFDQCGNARVIATEDQVIVAADVTNQANDVRQVCPMIETMQSNIEGELNEFLADAAYFSNENVTAVEAAGLDPFIATQRLQHHEKISDCPRGRAPNDLSPKQRMARKLRTKKGRETCRKRKWIVELVFGQIQECRGFHQFLLRRLKKMLSEWTLQCLAHSQLKAFRAKTA